MKGILYFEVSKVLRRTIENPQAAPLQTASELSNASVQIAKERRECILLQYYTWQRYISLCSSFGPWVPKLQGGKTECSTTCSKGVPLKELSARRSHHTQPALLSHEKEAFQPSGTFHTNLFAVKMTDCLPPLLFLQHTLFCFVWKNALIVYRVGQLTNELWHLEFSRNERLMEPIHLNPSGFDHLSHCVPDHCFLLFELESLE